VSAPTHDVRVSDLVPDSGADTGTDTGTDTGSDTAVDTAPPGPGDPCDPAADACTDGTACCVPCCSPDAVAVCTERDELGACPLPDLSIDLERATAHLSVETVSVAEDSCMVAEACVGGSGERTLLRFDTTTPNLGSADLILGPPEATPEFFEWSECHQHYHYAGYAQYALKDASGATVGTGHKQAFCVRDSEPWTADAEGEIPLYNCGFQGLSAGWADTYAWNLDCQWVDVTGLPAGDYTLVLEVNPTHAFPERSWEDNRVELPVSLP
jgi:hypothetical protein